MFHQNCACVRSLPPINQNVHYAISSNDQGNGFVVELLALVMVMAVLMALLMPKIEIVSHWLLLLVTDAVMRHTAVVFLALYSRGRHTTLSSSSATFSSILLKTWRRTSCWSSSERSALTVMIVHHLSAVDLYDGRSINELQDGVILLTFRL